MGEAADLGEDDFAELIGLLPVPRLGLCTLCAHSCWVRRVGRGREVDEGRTALGMWELVAKVESLCLSARRSSSNVNVKLAPGAFACGGGMLVWVGDEAGGCTPCATWGIMFENDLNPTCQSQTARRSADMEWKRQYRWNYTLSTASQPATHTDARTHLDHDVADLPEARPPSQAAAGEEGLDELMS